MANFNQVTLAGNITREPELKTVVSGAGENISLCEFGIAVDRKGSDKTDYFNVVAWRGLGEAIAKHKNKGDAILVEAKIQYGSWKNENGETRSRVQLVAENAQFLGAAGRGVNRLILAGNLTRNPEGRFARVGGESVPVCSFGLAVNRARGEGVDFVEVTAWDELATIVSEHKQKGDPVLVEGRLRYDSWEAEDGSKRSKVSINADQVQFLGRNGNGSGAGGSQETGSTSEAGGEIKEGINESTDFEDIPF